ncbi:MAG: 50S ribosomal protein L23 [Candidatus Izimaplasma sp.]|nr:50S ribosomal protein L23 [Candidatus Izimaplasma bacterium]
MRASEIIKHPIITEKTMLLSEQDNKYTFNVDKRANKIQIRRAVEELFDVKVTKVNKLKSARKKKRVGQHSGFKPVMTKAIVTLAEGDKIEIFEA